jgi:hypothetical protein
VNRHPSRRIALVATIAVTLIAILALVASGVLGAAVPSVKPPAKGAVTPSSPAVNRPSAVPTSNPVPSNPAVTPAPSGQPDDASDGVDVVRLTNWPGVESSVIVWDESDSLVDASSGAPDRDGPVPGDVIEAAGSVAHDALRLTWSDLPIASRAQLSIRHGADGKYRITLFRPHPQPPTDGVVSDRVLHLRFSVAVPIEDVEVKLVEGLAPPAGLGFVSSGLARSDGTGLSLAVWDETDSLAEARIEGSGGHATVAADEVRLVSVESDTLRVTWSDPEVAMYARLSIRVGEDGRLHLRLVREHPQGPTGPVAIDRVVTLVFHQVVVAEDIEVELLDSLANAG